MSLSSQIQSNAFSCFTFHKSLWKSFIMLSIVKVLGCIISDAMVILGKAKGIFKDVEV